MTIKKDSYTADADKIRISFDDIIEFLNPTPGASLTLGNVTFENLAVGRTYSLPSNQWDMATITADANQKLTPRWDKFIAFVKSRQDLIRPAEVALEVGAV